MNVDKALQILKENGYKHTKQREKLLEILAPQEQYISAQNVWKNLQKEFSGASYDTVYRNLYTMAELSILEYTVLNGEKHFGFHCETHGHHHHFICKTCGTMIPIEVCPIDKVETTLPNYQIDNHLFEVYGQCPTCQ